MSIILLILKIIGIIILSVIALILFLIGLVLFAPIRYNVSIMNNERFTAKTKVSFLGFVRLKLQYEEELSMSLKILFFELLGDKKSKKKVEKKSSDKSSKGETESEEDVTSNNIKNTSNTVMPETKETPETKEISEPVEEPTQEDDLNKNENNIEEGDSNTFLFKIKGIYGKIKQIIERIKNDFDVLTTDPVKRFISLCLQKLKFLLKKLLPRKINGSVVYSMDSPEKTGYVFAVYSVLGSFLRGKLSVSPDFNSDKTYANVDLVIKGNIKLYIFLAAALKIWLNRDFKKSVEALKNL